MARHLAYGGLARPVGRGVSSFACLAFVAVLGTAFWAGALWLGQIILTASASGF
jgi:hypothetical protein